MDKDEAAALQTENENKDTEKEKTSEESTSEATFSEVEEIKPENSKPEKKSVNVLPLAAVIILLHNHPSGDPTPSQADLTTTRKVIEAGKNIWQDVKTDVPNRGLKAMAESYKTRAPQEKAAQPRESAREKLEALVKDTAAKVSPEKPKAKSKAKKGSEL